MSLAALKRLLILLRCGELPVFLVIVYPMPALFFISSLESLELRFDASLALEAGLDLTILSVKQDLLTLCALLALTNCALFFNVRKFCSNGIAV